MNVTNGSSYTREGSYLDEKYTLDTKKESHSNGIGKGKLKYIQLVGLKND